MQEQEWHGVTHLYNYVEHMPALLCAADLILSKAGGLIVTKVLACGRPLLFIDVTPGQEEGNAEYVIRNGAGDWAKTPLKALGNPVPLDGSGQETAARARPEPARD